LHTAKSNRRLTYRFASSTVSPSHDDKNLHSVGIVGGGLAGLSTAYHLLQKQPSIHVTILDVALPGEGGASAVAGG
jgi:ribulose 1,5-bisphosphate synthetase/thiazole synthase